MKDMVEEKSKKLTLEKLYGIQLALTTTHAEEYEKIMELFDHIEAQNAEIAELKKDIASCMGAKIGKGPEQGLNLMIAFQEVIGERDRLHAACVKAEEAFNQINECIAHMIWPSFNSKAPDPKVIIK